MYVSAFGVGMYFRKYLWAYILADAYQAAFFVTVSIGLWYNYGVTTVESTFSFKLGIL